MRYFLFSIIALLLCVPAFAQKEVNFSLKRDSSYYYKYDDRLVVAMYQSYRTYNLLFSQTVTPDSTGRSILEYHADANNITGIELDYDKFSLSFGIKSSSPNTYKKGNTAYSNFGFSFGGNRWRLETSYRKYKGFYDIRTAAYDTTYRDSLPYYQNPSLTNRSVRAKFFYFFNNKKFSYSSAYSCTYRQTRTAFSWALVGNIYQNTLSADTSFFPHFVRNMYGGNADLNRLGVVGLSGGAGFSGNIVLFRSLFVNLTFLIGPEIQWRKYAHYSGASRTFAYLTGAGDGRASIGYNSRNFFMTLTTLNDFYATNGRGLQFTTKFISGAFTFGYRFKVKDPKFMGKVRENKFYKML